MNHDFKEVFRGHWRFVWSCARRHGAPDDALDDIVQEVFIAVAAQLSEFRGDANIRTWLYNITKNKVWHHLRGRTRHLRKVEAFATAQDERQDLDPFAREHAADELYRSLDQLDEMHRDVFVLVELEQLPGPEVAGILQLKLNTVYSRLRTACRKLRDYLDQSRKSAPPGSVEDDPSKRRCPDAVAS